MTSVSVVDVHGCSGIHTEVHTKVALVEAGVANWRCGVDANNIEGMIPQSLITHLGLLARAL